MKAKQERKSATPAMAKKRSPKKGPPVADKPATKFKIIKASGDREAENLSERYTDRYPDKAAEVWIWSKRESGAKYELAYRVYGLEHPLNAQGRKLVASKKRPINDTCH